MRKSILACLAFALAACQRAPAPPAETIDALARDYVELSLTIGEKDPGNIDAYYGPADLKAKAADQAPALSLPQLSQRAETLRGRVSAFQAANRDATAARRARFLDAQLKAAATRLRILRGEKLTFDDEAEGLFGVRPSLVQLSELDPILTRVDRIVPGAGDLPDRVDRFAKRFAIPRPQLAKALETTIAECRRRTARHIALPENERFDIAFVTGKSWGGYNYYQGNARSRIEINTDLPTRTSYAVDLGCHEGYPGHHTLNALLEQRLVKGRGWVEYSIYPLYSPQSLIGEGSANYGIKLAFPGREQLAFERDQLFPLAGIPASEAARYAEVTTAMERLTSARFTISRMLVDGQIDEAEAVRLLRRYELVMPDAAAKWIAFTKQYRSYVINYGIGAKMVQDYVEAAGPDPARRWKRFERLISEPTVPDDLRTRGTSG